MNVCAIFIFIIIFIFFLVDKIDILKHNQCIYYNLSLIQRQYVIYYLALVTLMFKNILSIYLNV